MKFILTDNFSDNNLEVLRKCGYHPHRSSRSNTLSFQRRLTGLTYPHFHIFLKRKNQQLIFDLHLDQKKPSYKRVKAHSGESDSPLIQNEIQRIKAILSKLFKNK